MGFNFTQESLISANVIGFAVMSGIIWWACVKFKLGIILEQQSRKIKNIVDTSEKNKTTSIERYKFAQSQIEKLPVEIKKLEAEAQSTAQVLAQNIQKEAHKKTDVIEKNIEKTIDFEVKKAKDKLSRDVAYASVQLAQSNFQELLKQNPDIHKQIISECINEL